MTTSDTYTELAEAAGRYAVQCLVRPPRKPKGSYTPMTRAELDEVAYDCARIAWRWALKVKS